MVQVTFSNGSSKAYVTYFGNCIYKGTRNSPEQLTRIAGLVYTFQQIKSSIIITCFKETEWSFIFKRIFLSSILQESVFWSFRSIFFFIRKCQNQKKGENTYKNMFGLITLTLYTIVFIAWFFKIRKQLAMWWCW